MGKKIVSNTDDVVYTKLIITEPLYYGWQECEECGHVLESKGGTTSAIRMIMVRKRMEHTKYHASTKG